MRLFAHYSHPILNDKGERTGTLMLSYSVLHFLSGNPRWFARVTDYKTWNMYESYATTKWAAVRGATGKYEWNVRH